ncbi:hypothetical protein BJP27_24000 (plasmid) [Pseudomonas oryzihabitans]|nr:hypothetical protein BJP27_24000 [Pseudomonas psychrotolerans]
MTQACADAIVAGFTDSALGAPHTYGSTIEDQLNLTGTIQMGSIFASDSTWKGGFKCTDSEGVKAMRDHTLKQLQEVGVTFALRKQTLISRKDTLVAKAMACTTVEDVQAVTWSEA